jgi:hypothetical protein
LYWDTGKASTSASGATFDLSKLQEWTESNPLEAHDAFRASDKDYKYTFGICNTIAPPKDCAHNENQDHYWSPAWQTNSSEEKIGQGTKLPNGDTKHCMYLGGNGEGKMKRDAEFSLLDEDDAAAGVRLTYINGQHCTNHGGPELRRKLKLNFKCSEHTAGLQIGQDVEQPLNVGKNIMDESAHCAYEITIFSQFACPTQCGYGGGHAICNSHGVCGYDTDTKQARCFCNEGFAGPGCDQAQEKEGLQGYGPILGLLIFVSVALLGLVGAVVGLWRFMSQRTVPLDGQTYARLEDDGSFTPMRMDVKGPDGL